jgi:16S rRNA processing protein RimM
LIRFAAVPDRTAAEELRGVSLYVAATDRRELDPGEFWPDELVGMTVRSTSGAVLGVVREVVEGSAQHRLVVDAGDRSFEVPFVEALVPEVDREFRVLVIADLPGLVPDV